MDIAPARKLRWVVFYGQMADHAVLAAYDIVILDPGFLGSVKDVSSQGAKVYGYLSLGEIHMASPFSGKLASDALLAESPFWQGTRHIDVRHPSWHSLVLDQLVPAILARGFTGVMLDTLDTPPYLEQRDSKHNAGMQQAAIDLVRAIRSRFPTINLIMNRGYALLPELADILDALIAESLLTKPDPATGIAKWNNAGEVAQQLVLLTPAMSRPQPLPILSLDYWVPEDTATIGLIYRRERKLGHHPYVATPLLDQIVKEP